REAAAEPPLPAHQLSHPRQIALLERQHDLRRDVRDAGEVRDDVGSAVETAADDLPVAARREVALSGIDDEQAPTERREVDAQVAHRFAARLLDDLERAAEEGRIVVLD